MPPATVRQDAMSVVFGQSPLLSLSLFPSVSAHYIQPCSRNDPNLNACAKQHAIQAIPQFINGKRPSFSPHPLRQTKIELLSQRIPSLANDVVWYRTNLLPPSSGQTVSQASSINTPFSSLFLLTDYLLSKIFRARRCRQHTPPKSLTISQM
jgi:hypothetical protein